MEENTKSRNVKWKTLGEIGEIYGGISGKKKEDFKNGNKKLITYKNVYENLSLNLNVEDKVRIKENEKQRKLKYGDIIFTGSSENLKECGLSSVVAETPNEELYLNSFCFFLRLNDDNLLLPNFSKHLFRSEILRKKIIKTASGVTRFNVSKELMKKIQIPLPPLKKQEEIVAVLDKFTELTEELTAREAQYEYYRDMLLSEDYLNKISKTNDSSNNNQIRFTTLGEVAQINRGASPRPISNFLTDDESGIAWIKIGDIEANSKYVTKTVQKITFEGAQKSRILKKGDFIISNSMSYGHPYILKIDGAIHDGWASISNFENHLDSDFLYHFLNSSMAKNYWKRKINGSLVSNLNSEIICSLPIIIVDKKLQKKIAQKLDKFQSLLSNTQGLLPKEIKLRQKQYEYYREKLLTF